MSGQVVKVGNFAGKLLDDGTYVYKALTPTFFKPGTGILKKQYHDMPRFNVILDYEKEAKQDFDIEMAMAIKDIVDELKTFIVK